jgi:hypothetical protein
MMHHKDDDNMILCTVDTTITIIADSVTGSIHKFDNVMNRLSKFQEFWLGRSEFW